MCEVLQHTEDFIKGSSQPGQGEEDALHHVRLGSMRASAALTWQEKIYSVPALWPGIRPHSHRERMRNRSLGVPLAGFNRKVLQSARMIALPVHQPAIGARA